MRLILSILSFCFAFSTVSAHEGPMGPPLAAHLTFARAGVHAHLYWDVAPSVTDEAKLRLEFKRVSDHAATEPPAEVYVDLFMPEMGHGAPPSAIEHTGVGIYEASNLYFIMGGDWEVHVTLKLPDGTEEMQKFSVHVGEDSSPGDPHHH